MNEITDAEAEDHAAELRQLYAESDASAMNETLEAQSGKPDMRVQIERDAEIVARELNKRRQNGDLISEDEVLAAMRVAAGQGS